MSEKNKKINNIEIVDGTSNTTPQASLHLVNKFFEQTGLSRLIDSVIGVRKSRGASDSDHVKAMVMSQIIGNDTIEDLKNLAERVEPLGVTVPSVSAARDFARVFHDSKEDKFRGKGHSYIPKENEYLSGFTKIHTFLLETAHKLNPLEEITLDQDATLIPTGKLNALYNYNGEKSYEAFNTYCPEYDLMVGTQYRDGNVPAGFGQLEELERVLSCLPAGVKKVKLRSDSAGYQIDFMKYCATKENKRFGAIEFAISCDIGKEFKEAVLRVDEESWRPLRRKEDEPVRWEWAEVSYTSNRLSSSKEIPDIRFYATREVFKKTVKKSSKASEYGPEQKMIFPQELIDELESGNENIKALHLTAMSGQIYKVFGIASNIQDKPGDEIILWSRERCGKAEEAHSVLKNDFGGGHVPSKLFGVNALWWNISVLSMNISNLLKIFFLPAGFECCRMKKLRNGFYTLTGKVVHHARKTVLKIWSRDSGAKLLIHALSRLERFFPSAT